jgi:hypothetical protein
MARNQELSLQNGSKLGCLKCQENGLEKEQWKDEVIYFLRRHVVPNNVL